MVNIRNSREIVLKVTNDIVLSGSESTLELDSSSNSIDVTIPPASEGFYKFTFEFKDVTNPITFTPDGLDTFESIAPKAGSTYIIQSDGVSNYFVISSEGLAILDTIPTSLSRSMNDAGNATTVATIIGAYTIPGGYLVNDGEVIEQLCVGTFAANANNKKIEVILGVTTVFDSGIQAQNGGSWKINAKVFKVGVNQRVCVEVVYSDGVTLFENSVTYTETAENLANNKPFRVWATGVATNDIVNKIRKVTHTI